MRPCCPTDERTFSPATLCLLAGLVLDVTCREALADRWDRSQPPPEVAWQAELGEGFAGVAVPNDRVFAFDNVTDEDRVTALDAASRRVVWQYGYPCRALGIAKPDERGPRATTRSPAISKGPLSA